MMCCSQCLHLQAQALEILLGLPDPVDEGTMTPQNVGKLLRQLQSMTSQKKGIFSNTAMST